MKKIAIISSILIFFSQTYGQNPSNLKWSQINTQHFRLIFPSQISATANRTANVLETVYQPVSKNLGYEPRPISIILQNQTAASNGFVSMLPRRSEFIITPPQDYTLLGNNNWLDLLAVHEFRHVVQNDKALEGPTKWAFRLFGNNGLAATTFLTVPNWFWEGDAVGVESSLTTSGRGRIPSFDMALRTQLLTKGAYSYSKAVCRSYKDFIPNHYVSGYFMTTYLKNKYGIDAWDKVLEGTYKMPFYPFSFSNNIKKTTGLKTEQLYNQAFTDISEQWKIQIAEIIETPVSTFKSDKNKFFTNYQYPQILADGRVLALKSGLSDIEQFVILDTLRSEESVLRLGIFNDAKMLSVSGSKVVWAEFNYDPRWTERDYSVIKLYDFNTKKIKTVTHKSKLASPSISTNGNRICAIENSVENRNTIVILDVNGLEIKRLENPQNALYINARWSDNDDMYAVKLLNGLKTIVKIDVENGQETELFEPLNENIAHPVKHKNYVLYNSGVTGIDNIFAFDTISKKKYQVTNRKFGAFNPTISKDGTVLIFNDFTINGHEIVSIPFSPKNFLPFDEKLNKPVRYFGDMVMKEAGENFLKSVPSTQYNIKKYSKANIFNIYSWGAVINSLEFNSLNAGISSKDLLSTTEISAGYNYNANENQGQFYTNFTYKGWYPTLSLSLTNGGRQAQFYVDGVLPLDSLRSDKWNQQQVVVGIGLPLNFTRSKYLQTMNIGINAAFTQISGYDLTERLNTITGNGNFNSLIYNFSYNIFLKRATRDIAPRWGFTTNFYKRSLIDGSKLEGDLTSFQASILTPGLFRHHSFRVRGAYQNQGGFKKSNGSPNNNLYVFSSPIFFPRGYSYGSFENLSSLSAEYRLPLADPDWAIGRFLYLKRLKTNLFADYAYGNTEYSFNNSITGKRNIFRNYNSFGIDLTAQFHLLRFSQQFEAGVRVIYLNDKSQFMIQPLVLDIGF